MEKFYYDYINDISENEIFEGLLGFGMFSDKLPPFLTSEIFLEYCLKNPKEFNEKETNEYINYENMRNINIPRILSIPNPFSYYNLCYEIQSCWREIQKHFYDSTRQNSYKISQIHLRKISSEKSLFKMNYKKYPLDISHVEDFLVGKKYLVEADISNCFPSIYSHALSWALVGKTKAKRTQRDKKLWYNKLDFYTRNCKDGETHGLLVGPHVSNLLSEIILTRVDKKLSEKWQYVRNIDDYSCYTRTYEEAQLFVSELSKELRYYDLSLNHKKTKIHTLPIPSESLWVQEIQSLCCFNKAGFMKYSEIKRFFDLTISIMQKNDENAAILNYAIKIISGKKLSQNAKKYFYKIVCHFVGIYPYLIPLLEKYIFEALQIEISEIQAVSQSLYDNNIMIKNYEGASYALYYSIKYKFDLKNINFEDIKETGDCILFLLHYLYDKFINNKKDEKKHRDLAKEIVNRKDINRYWVYVYEVLTIGNLKDKWKNIKSNNITFINYKNLNK